MFNTSAISAAQISALCISSKDVVSRHESYAMPCMSRPNFTMLKYWVSAYYGHALYTLFTFLLFICLGDNRKNTHRILPLGEMKPALPSVLRGRPCTAPSQAHTCSAAGVHTYLSGSTTCIVLDGFPANLWQRPIICAQICASCTRKFVLFQHLSIELRLALWYFAVVDSKDRSEMVFLTEAMASFGHCVYRHCTTRAQLFSGRRKEVLK